MNWGIIMKTKEMLTIYLSVIMSFPILIIPGSQPAIAAATEMDYGFAVATDAQGNVYIAGSTYSYMNDYYQFNATSTGISAMFLRKYDSNGNLLWTEIDSNSDAPNATNGQMVVKGIAVDSSYVYVVGYNYSCNVSHVMHYNIIVQKYHIDGSNEGPYDEIGIPRDYNEYGYAIALDNNNGFIYITGYSQGNQYNNYIDDVITMKIRKSDLVVIWSKFLSSGNNRANVGMSITYCSPYVFVTGYKTNENNNKDLLIVKYWGTPVQTGNATWSPPNDADDDIGYSIKSDSCYVYIEGISYNHGSGDAVLLKFNNSFVRQQNFPIYWGGNHVDTGRGIAIDDTFIYTCGDFASDAVGCSDIFLMKYSKSDGTEQWTEAATWGTTSTERPYSIASDMTNPERPIIYVCGITNQLYASSWDALVVQFYDNGDYGDVNNHWYFGGSKYDKGAAIAVGSDGSIYVVGTSNSIGIHNGYASIWHHEYYRGILVEKFNSSGICLWHQYYNYLNYGDGVGIGLVLDSNSGLLYVLGNVKTNREWANDCWTFIVLRYYISNGTLIEPVSPQIDFGFWAYDEYGTGMYVDSTNIYVSGYYTDSASNKGLFVERLNIDTSDNISAYYPKTGLGNNNCQCVANAITGDSVHIFITGYFINQTTQNKNVYLDKISKTYGTEVWNPIPTWTTQEEDIGNALCYQHEDVCDYIYLAGYQYGQIYLQIKLLDGMNYYR